jgi:hypothetical protein
VKINHTSFEYYDMEYYTYLAMAKIEIKNKEERYIRKATLQELIEHFKK